MYFSKNTISSSIFNKKLREKKIEFRLGSAGGGNQMRQPYVKDYLGKANFNNFPNVEHIHFYGMYIGNYPSLPKDDLEYIIKTINLWVQF